MGALKIHSNAEKFYTTLVLDGEVRKDIIPEVQKEVAAILLYSTSVKAVLVDLEFARTIDDATMRELMQISNKLKGSGIKLYLVKPNAMIQSKVNFGGLSDSLSMKPDTDAALIDAGLKSATKIKINVEIINPFISGAINTLKIQAGTESKAGTPYLKTNAPSALKIDIVAILGVVSNSYNGSIALCFPKDLYLSIVNHMLGDDYKEINDENADIAAELLNIIFGAAKQELNQKNYGLQPAIPTVIRGADLQMKNLIQDPTIVLPISTNKGNFEILIGITTK